MSEKANQKTPQYDPQLIAQLMAGRKTPRDIEDLLKDLRKRSSKVRLAVNSRLREAPGRRAKQREFTE